ncbi:unnamed protein product [Phytophthora fragariaefolia]|uniref:Unnamed protein product n=1 Tax=Phytophthora fragariaefolia TaxID=1490495 RepID=A0A9W6XRB5_9STRA|nr:unnamed protein product [Phytophthora fragariaefolia]
MEPLYQWLQAGEAHMGIIIQIQAGKVTLRVAGYADDTAIYLSGTEELFNVLHTVNVFGEASGLLPNRAKTMVIALHSDGLARDTTWPGAVRRLPVEQQCRYLGIQVGSTPGAASSWDLAGDQLRVQIRLAGHRTLTVDQRARVASAVIIPKLVYIGHHA